MSSRRRDQRRLPAGQAIVELAVVLPVLLLLTVGLVNLGLMIVAQMELTQAAWEGARAGATISDPVAGDREITGAVRAALFVLNSDEVEIDIEPTQDDWPRSEPGPLPRGHPLTVRLRYQYPLRLPLAIEVPLEAQAVSRMEYQNP